MIVDGILTAGQIAGAIAAIIGAIVLVGKYVIQRPLDRRIIEVTKQIQPTANGGLSLPDAIKAIHEVKKHVVATERKIENVSKRVEKLEENICK